MGSEIIVIPAIFIGLPWVIMHYLTKWRQAPRITEEDERLLDEMHLLARRLEERLNTVERIAAADNPDFKPGLTAPASEWRPGMTGGQPNYQIERRN